MDQLEQRLSLPRRPLFVEIDPPRTAEQRDELLRGLRASQAAISPKYFYDALGSRLFEAICELPEYYLPRAEREIIDEHGAEIAAAVGPGCTLIDLGAGNCEKAERLFGLLQPAQYVAVDISIEFLREKLQCLQDRHPRLEIIGVGQDFSRRLALPPQVRARRRLFFYPGSSIGNFAPEEAARFIDRIREHCGADGRLLLGVDLVKEKTALEAAYDDALGITAAFNLNVLNNVNRILGSDFVVRDWRHVALFNGRESRIEMHLEAKKEISVCLPGGRRVFRTGERIHTENSYKLTRPLPSAWTQAWTAEEARCLVDRQQRFAVALF
jgi:dimethylhistidine N-methyltransferase